MTSAMPARREYAANRILDDERLRGGLSDDAFQPLQDWALAWVDAYARATVLLADEAARQAIDAGVAWVGQQMRALTALLLTWPGASVDQRRSALAGLAPTFPAPRLAEETEPLLAVSDQAALAKEIGQRLPRAPE